MGQSSGVKGYALLVFKHFWKLKFNVKLWRQIFAWFNNILSFTVDLDVVGQLSQRVEYQMWGRMASKATCAKIQDIHSGVVLSRPGHW